MSSRGDRWDREYEDRYERPDRPRYDDNKYYMRGGRGRDASEDGFDRRPPPRPKAYDDDYVRDRRHYDDEPRYPRREFAPEYERRGPPVMEREREREYYPRGRSPARPSFLRRQSSLDTFDRRPLRQFYEREEYPPPARREDVYRDEYRDEYRAPRYTDIPISKTKTKALPAPRRYEDRQYEDIKVAEPDYYGDDDFRPYPDRVREREYIREHRHDDRGSPAPTRRARRRRGSSPTSTTVTTTTSSRSSSSDGGTTVKSEYPKKGKTRIPARLVSMRAIIDIGYPFTEEGNTIIVQRALGQDNIDELLKLSEEYKKSEMEIAAARSSAGNLAEERREEVYVPPPVAAPAPAPAPVPVAAPPPAPVVAHGPVIVDAAPARAPSPSYTSTTTTSYEPSHYHHYPEASRPVPVGPVALMERSRSRSRSRGGRELRAEIRALERELAHRPKHHGDREIVRAERLPDGQLVVYEEQVEEVVHTPKPARIEKDKKGPPPKLVRAMLSTLT